MASRNPPARVVGALYCQCRTGPAMPEAAYRLHAPHFLVDGLGPWAGGASCPRSNASWLLWLGASTTVVRISYLRLHRHSRGDRFRSIATGIVPARDLCSNRWPRYSDPRRSLRQQPESESTAVVVALRPA